MPVLYALLQFAGQPVPRIGLGEGPSVEPREMRYVRYTYIMGEVKAYHLHHPTPKNVARPLLLARASASVFVWASFVNPVRHANLPAIYTIGAHRPIHRHATATASAYVSPL